MTFGGRSPKFTQAGSSGNRLVNRLAPRRRQPALDEDALKRDVREVEGLDNVMRGHSSARVNSLPSLIIQVLYFLIGRFRSE
jgi:hypothetical protein